MVQVREEAYQYYFHFMEKRMEIFWKKQQNELLLTDDEILQKNKFTNVYRVLDRVSQYLVKEVIYKNIDGFSSKDILLRILVFKIFNRIDTWEFIEEALERPLKVESFDVGTLTECLSYRIKEQPIFNSAYMMTGSHQKYKEYHSKHEKWLKMVENEMLNEGGFDAVLEANSLEEVYKILLSKSFIGGFLAYQYAIDFNYSPVVNFDENSFVKAGIGAIRGIKKCFVNYKEYTYEYLIKYTQEHLEEYQQKYGCTGFKNLYGHQPTLIDLQNCFCETDKYLRAKMPELNLGNTRIKQRYKANGSKIELFFPPKWNLNQHLITV